MAASKIAKPFLKWAGGKTQLLADIQKALPQRLLQEDFTYMEPFVGSGAVLFWMLHQFPNLKKAVINDINIDLINTYRVIAEQPQALLSVLAQLQGEFHALEHEADNKKAYYYQQRERYNAREADRIEQAALFIFLNRTCFNGLYRVNRQNKYNVPMGSYKRPTICDPQNILAVSEALQKVEILCGDFEQTLNHATAPTLFYLDPPYKPLSETSSFNSYAQEAFDDGEQIRLRDFCNQLHSRKHSWILSNSDPKSTDGNNGFFDNLYADFDVRRVAARRSINADASKRGALREVLISNQTNSVH